MARGCYVGDFLPGSFKGVPIEILQSKESYGRRGAVGEFPFSETTAYADLGRKADRISISGRFAENSHVRDAAVFIAACKSPGAGILVHPTRGVLTVALETLDIDDDFDEAQGVTYFEATFVEANEWASGLNFLSNLFGIDLGPVVAAVSASFVNRFRPDDVRWYQAPAVTATAAEAIDQIATTYQRATSATSDKRVWQVLNDFRTVQNDPFTVRDPETLFLAMQNGMQLVDEASSGERKIMLFRQLANWGAKGSGLSGEAADAQESVYTAVRVLAVGHIVRGILETRPTTVAAALQQLDMVSSIIEQEIQIANTNCADPQLFMALRTFLIETQRTLYQRAYGLPALINYRFAGPTHSLVAAYEIYADATRSRDLETRNPQYFPWQFGPDVVATQT